MSNNLYLTTQPSLACHSINADLGTIQTGICQSCGRDFQDELPDGSQCPSDDCPSHHEEKGLPYLASGEDALYSVKFNNDTARTMTGHCLKNCYLSSQKHCIKSYEALPGAWYDLLYQEKKLFGVYAVNEAEALNQKMEALNNLRIADLSLVTAIRSVT